MAAALAGAGAIGAAAGWVDRGDWRAGGLGRGGLGAGRGGGTGTGRRGHDRRSVRLRLLGGLAGVGARGGLLIELLDLDLDPRPEPLHPGDHDPIARLDPLLDLPVAVAEDAGRPDVAHRSQVDRFPLLAEDRFPLAVLLLLDHED